MHLTVDDVSTLACPTCVGALQFHGQPAQDGRLDTGTLDCVKCGRTWPIRGGFPELLDQKQVQGSDRWLRIIYDLIAPGHDLGVNLALPLMQFPDNGASRDRYMERMDLENLQARSPGPPLRILEVGIGSGANLPLLERALPMHVDIEFWGLDISRAMIRECRRRLPWYTERRVRLVLGDSHTLPFPDASFDRVFHVGGINGYRDPKRALAEMARVARPDTPIVVVDEELDPNRTHALYHYVMFWSLTWFDSDPEAPVKHLPAGATAVDVSRVSRFYYCLTFRMPRKPAAATEAPARDGENSHVSQDVSEGERFERRLQILAAKGSRPVIHFRRESASTTQGGSPMGQVKDILTQIELTAIETAYDPVEMAAIMRGLFLDSYPPSKAWVDALGGAFDANLPPDDQVPPRDRLSLRDRERCIIAILGSHGGGLQLAIHIYIAIANKVSAEEIAHVLFLTGVYTGVDNFAKGLTTEINTLVTLKGLVGKNTLKPLAVVQGLSSAFAG